MDSKNHKVIGSGQDVDDYAYLCEGDTEPRLTKRINTLILSAESFIVYLDDDYFVEWSTNDKYLRWASNFGDIMNKVSLLETKSISLLGKKHILPFRRLLGECVARILDDQENGIAEEFLLDAENYLRERSLERAKIWYLATNAITCSVIMLAMIILYLNRITVVGNLGKVTFDILIVSLFGSLGAFISVLNRLQKINMDAASGPLIHCFEEGVRIIIGVLGSFLSVLAIKSDLVLGIANNNLTTLYPLIVIGIVSGASERFVPNMIKTLENSITGRDLKSSNS